MESPLEEAPAGHASEALGRFSAEALDWPAVRELLAREAPSPLGRRALTERAPLPDEEARRALARTSELAGPLARSEEPPLEGAPDPVPTLTAAARYRRTLAGPDLVAVAKSLRVVEDAGHWLRARAAELPTCAKLWRGFSDPSGLASLLAELERSLDRRGRVTDDATPVLARLRTEIRGLTRDVERRLRELAGSSALRTALADGHAGKVIRRGTRRVLAVKKRHAGQVPGTVHDRSQSGETLFVEPREVVESGNRLAELEADAEREAARVLTELTRSVMRKREAIELVCERRGELELAMISARFARRTGGRPARLPGDPGAPETGLVLRSWRHPLLLEEEAQRHIDEVVAVDLRLGEEFDVLVVTGPNTGGKTLALKGAGLAVLMTRLGFALPCAEGTTVPLYAGIVADIGDEQEIQQNLSTFSSHLVRIRDGLARADADTLVLLDELGGGTDPTEGAALGEAILERLLAAGIPTLASTHLGKLKEFAFRHARVENAHVVFDLASLAPRYSLVIGAPGESRALAIARRLGLPDEILAAAAERLEPDAGEAERLMEEMRDVRLGAERLRAEAEDRLHRLESRETALALERESMEGRRNQLEAEAQRGLEERVRGARAWIERGRGLLERIEGKSRADVEAFLEGLEDALSDASLSERRRTFLEGLKKGSSVWLPRFKKRCTVARIYKDRRELDVALGRQRMRVGFDDVTFYEAL